jgi:hypothetical protein
LSGDAASAVGAQLQGVLEFLQSPGAVQFARRCAVERGLAPDLAGDLVHDAWLRTRSTFQRRTEPYPDLDGDDAFRRYAWRVIATAAIDRARLSAHRREVLASPDAHVHHADASNEDRVPLAPLGMATDDPGYDAVDWRTIGVRWRTAVAHEVDADIAPCPGCAGTLVAAVALHICNCVAAGRLGSESLGDSELDALLYDGLTRYDTSTFSSTSAVMSAAQRKKKSRCGRCIVDLLRTAATRIGMAAS